MITRRWLLLIVALTFFRAMFLLDWGKNFDADEAIMGLQAREFLQGRFPLFFPGQSYMGSLQAMIAAPCLAILGHHPAALRLSPLLWVLPSLAALLILDRHRQAGRSDRQGAFWLAFCWCLPPVTLALASVKARGGSLEMLALGLWSLVLARSRSEEPLSRAMTRSAGGGLLLGVALWTQAQAALFIPPLVVFLFTGSRRFGRGAGVVAGLFLGYLPIWLPRLAPLAVGPPGTEGTLYRPAVGALLDAGAVERAWWIVQGTLTARRELFGRGNGPEALYLLLTLALAALAVRAAIATVACMRSGATAESGGPVRPARTALSPSLAITGWLAAASIAVVAATPAIFEDSQWFRYLVPVAPFFAVLQARGLASLRRPIAWALALLLGFCSGLTLLRNPAMWRNSELPDPRAIVRHLEDRGVDRIRAEWWVAYPLRFWSEDRILAADRGVLRFPEVAAAVDCAARSWRVQVHKGGTGVSPDSLDGWLGLTERQTQVTPAVEEAFRRVDPPRTLFPHYEPFPLLPPGWTGTDWRGWPPRRDLRLFDHVVWLPRLAQREGLRDSLDRVLGEMAESGEWRVVEQWPNGRILERTGRSRP